MHVQATQCFLSYKAWFTSAGTALHIEQRTVKRTLNGVLLDRRTSIELGRPHPLFSQQIYPVLYVQQERSKPTELLISQHKSDIHGVDDKADLMMGL